MNNPKNKINFLISPDCTYNKYLFDLRQKQVPFFLCFFKYSFVQMPWSNGYRYFIITVCLESSFLIIAFVQSQVVFHIYVNSLPQQQLDDITALLVLCYVEGWCILFLWTSGSTSSASTRLTTPLSPSSTVLANYYRILGTQPAITCSKSTIETPEICEICSKLTIKTPMASFWCLYC